MQNYIFVTLSTVYFDSCYIWFSSNWRLLLSGNCSLAMCFQSWQTMASKWFASQSIHFVRARPQFSHVGEIRKGMETCQSTPWKSAWIVLSVAVKHFNTRKERQKKTWAEVKGHRGNMRPTPTASGTGLNPMFLTSLMTLLRILPDIFFFLLQVRCYYGMQRSLSM